MPRLGARVLLVLLLAAMLLPRSTPARPPDGLPLEVAYTLYADLSGWRNDLGERNPTLRVMPGENVTVTIEYVNSLHNWAVYPGGTLPGDVNPGSPDAFLRSSDVWSGNPTENVTFSLPAGIYEYFCEYHPFSMQGRIVVGANTPPSVGLISVAPLTPVEGEVATFTAPSVDSDGDALSYRWDFGDGSTSNGNTAPGGGTIMASHAYASPGVFNVTLTVADPAGDNATQFLVIAVARPPGWNSWIPIVVIVAGILVGGLALVFRVLRARRPGSRGRSPP